MKAGAILTALVLLAASPILPAHAEEDFGGLPPGPGQEDTFYICSACHSIKMVTQQRLSRHRWDQLLDWMVEEQGMSEMEPDERQTILDYLGTYLNPDNPRETDVPIGISGG